MHKALIEFYYAADGVNPVRYPAGALVPVRPEHVARIVADGKILAEDGDPDHVAAVQAMAGPHDVPRKPRRKRAPK